jgi:hypothetical protein
LGFRRWNGCNCDRKIVISRPLGSDGAAVWHETPKISAVTMDVAADRNLTVNPGRGKVFRGLTTPRESGPKMTPSRTLTRSYVAPVAEDAVYRLGGSPAVSRP